MTGRRCSQLQNVLTHALDYITLPVCNSQHTYFLVKVLLFPLQYVGPASNAVLWCGICANLKAASAVQTCISDVLKSSNSFCVQWLSSNDSSSSGTAVDLAATEQCFDCMKRTGAPASKCAR